MRYTISTQRYRMRYIIYKSEFESAAREAFVAVESYLKKKSGLDSHGFDLATRALSFEIDKQTGEIRGLPLLQSMI